MLSYSKGSVSTLLRRSQAFLNRVGMYGVSHLALSSAFLGPWAPKKNVIVELLLWQSIAVESFLVSEFIITPEPPSDDHEPAKGKDNYLLQQMVTQTLSPMFVCHFGFKHTRPSPSFRWLRKIELHIWSKKWDRQTHTFCAHTFPDHCTLRRQGGQLCHDHKVSRCSSIK